MKRSSSKKIAESKPTTPDLVLLSLLAERPMHGYQAYSLLVFREWGISRPQVYYSLEKLDRLGLIRSARDAAESGGPERRVFATTDSGRAALADALEQEDWTTHFDQPLFLTWLALSWQARPGVFLKQLERRKDFLEAELARKQEILRAVQKEVGHRYHEAVWILSLLIGRLRTELRWLRNVIRESPLRAPAREPEYLGNPGRTQFRDGAEHD